MQIGQKTSPMIVGFVIEETIALTEVLEGVSREAGIAVVEKLVGVPYARAMKGDFSLKKWKALTEVFMGLKRQEAEKWMALR